MGKLELVLKIYLLVSVVALSAGFIFLYIKFDNLSKIQIAGKEPSTASDLQTANQFSVQNVAYDTCGEECKKEINKVVSQAVATTSGTKKSATTTSVPIPTAVPKSQIVFIPLTATFTTTNMTWTDVPGTDIYINLVSEYGVGARAWWDAFLTVADANGTVYARLYDVTHSIGVSGSDVMLENIGTSTQVSSGQLGFWAGRNLYRVQIRSLNSFIVSFTNGRIKIAY
jgi:hypothetical protein